MKVDDKKNREKIHLNLVIDEHHTEMLEFYLDEDINEIAETIRVKYKLKLVVKEKIIDYIENYIKSEILKKKQDINLKNRKIREKTIERLYYKSLENNDKKQKINKLIKAQELNLNDCTFSPRINYNQNIFENRKLIKIEEKLIRDGEISKEKKAMMKIIKNVENRENLEIEKRRNFLHYTNLTQKKKTIQKLTENNPETEIINKIYICNSWRSSKKR